MNNDEINERLAKLEQAVTLLQSEVSELANRQTSFAGEFADLHEASSTLSRWVEQLAEKTNVAEPE